MRNISTFFLLSFVFVLPASWGIEFGPIDYKTPQKYMSDLSNQLDHPAYQYESKLRQAFAATIFLPQRGTASLISQDGLVVTAAHVIAHRVIGATKDCSKIVFYLNHQLDDEGKLESPIQLPCQEVLVYSNESDFALLKVSPPAQMPVLPFIPLAKNGTEPEEGSLIIVAGHPHALDYNKSYKVISEGPIFYNGSASLELPHFLHLANTDGGHSGSPVLTSKGELIGIHFRGVPQFGEGVEGTLNGQRQVLHRFNVAIYLPYFAQKFAEFFPR